MTDMIHSYHSFLTENTLTRLHNRKPTSLTVITQTFTISASDIEVRYVATQQSINVDVTALTNTLSYT